MAMPPYERERRITHEMAHPPVDGAPQRAYHRVSDIHRDRRGRRTGAPGGAGEALHGFGG